MGSRLGEVSSNCYAKLASSPEKGAQHPRGAFMRESIRAQCHSKQDDEKNGAEIAALQIQKAWVALSTFKIGRREERGGWLIYTFPGDKVEALGFP